jgi:AcrR family transcriptional regulator
MRKGLTPERVADAAAAIADVDGLEALTIAHVAAELGVRAPSLYNHVASRAELLRAVKQRGAAELADTLRDAVVGRSGSDAVRALAHAYRGFARERPGRYCALNIVTDDTIGQEAVDVVVATLRAWDLENDDALHAVRIIRASLHGFVLLETEGGFGAPIDVDESFDRLVATLIAGLGG